MAASKPEMTWADYLAVGVAPVFIMALVGSLCYFLLDIGYAGEFAGRLQWILFWFVFGSVMLARVSITQGVAHAGMLGLGLGLATALAVFCFVNQPIIGCLLIGLIWWCSHKLTWNCTFIDDTVDPSAAGLLETAGQDDRLAERRIGTRSPAEKVRNPLADDTFRAEEALRHQQAPAWKRLWRSITDLEPKAHAPGLSVLYFSLAALPLFGFGQWLIPAGAADRQAAAFRWLVVYLAAGLSLLLITSFLGLRRYLRRRNLEMPAAMTTSWIGVGGAMIVALLVGMLIMPLPSARHDWAVAVRDRLLTSPEREASQIAPLKSGGTQSENPDAAKSTDGKPPEEPAESTKDAGESGQPSNSEQSDNGDKSGGDQSNGDGESQSQSGEPGNSADDSQKGGDGQQAGDEQRKGDSSKSSGGRSNPSGSKGQSQSQTAPPDQSSQQPGDQSGSPSTPPPPAHSPATPPNPLQSLSWLRPLFWIALAVIVLVAAVVYRHQLMALLREIAEIWRGLWQMVFPRKTREKVDELAPVKPPFLPFSHFANPFADGRAQRASTDELVKFTFAALEAWAYEHGAAHRAEETPLEFTTRLATHFTALGPEAARLGGWLTRSLYARQSPPKESLATLESLWRSMQSTRAQQPAELIQV